MRRQTPCWILAAVIAFIPTSAGAAHLGISLRAPRASADIPVAILSSHGFDPTAVDPESVTLAGASVALVGKGDRFACESEDVNADGRMDFVCHITTAQFMLEPGDFGRCARSAHDGRSSDPRSGLRSRRTLTDL